MRGVLHALGLRCATIQADIPPTLAMPAARFTLTLQRNTWHRSQCTQGSSLLRLLSTRVFLFSILLTAHSPTPHHLFKIKTLSISLTKTSSISFTWIIAISLIFRDKYLKNLCWFHYCILKFFSKEKKIKSFTNRFLFVIKISGELECIYSQGFQEWLQTTLAGA